MEMQKYISELPHQNAQMQKLHFELMNCASYLLFHDYYTVEQLRLISAKTCKKHLLCPFCSGRRAAKYVDKSITAVQEVLSGKHNFKPSMITLTVKNGESLTERYLHLKNAFKSLQKRRRDYLSRGTGWTEFVNVVGGIYAYEVTNKGQGWHPHIHIFALLNNWIDQKALSEEWLSITGDSSIVGVQLVKPKVKAGGLTIETAMLEVIKYSTKFSDMTLEDTYHAFEVLRGKRLLGSFGNLRGVKVPDDLMDDPLQGLPYLELMYGYNRSRCAYDLLNVAQRPQSGNAGQFSCVVERSGYNMENC